ncbi:MAG: aminoglycoside adenylyltransferase domain-containing protein [Tetrasphaera sp.]
MHSATHRADLPGPLRDYLDDLATIVTDALGRDLRGMWLIGSSAQGAYEHGISDVDVLVVSRSRWSRPDRERLAGRIVHPALVCPAVGLECVWYAEPDLAPLGSPIVFQANVNGGQSREPMIALEPDGEPQWWAPLDLAAARMVGLSRIGPPAADVIPEIPWPRLRQAIEQSQAFHDGPDSGSPNRVLNLARLIALVEDGRWLSKPAGAQWLSRAEPGFAPALDEALRARAEGRWLDPTLADGLSDRLAQGLGARGRGAQGLGAQGLG